MSDSEMNMSLSCSNKRKLENGQHIDTAAAAVTSKRSKTEDISAAISTQAVIVVSDDEEDNHGFVTPSPQKKPRDSPTKEDFLTPSPQKKATDTPSRETGCVSNGSCSSGTSPAKAKKVSKKPALSPEQEAKQAEKDEKKRQQAAKRAEKAEKDAQKEAKKQKEAQAKARAANFMSSFVVQRPRSASPVKAESTKITTVSDFDRVFQACTYKDLAPINRFASSSSSSSSSSTLAQPSDKVLSKESLLLDFKSKCPVRKSGSRSRKGIHPPVSVRESMRLITEASVMGDEKLEESGKRGLASLSDPKKVPLKLLHFASDRRPAWYGTWTRATNLVGARKPLGQDPVALDYSYDSDAEWEDEDPNDGDDVQDNDDKEEEEGERSDDDSEMDDWLVDDLEEEEEDESAALPDDLDVFGEHMKLETGMPSLLSRPAVVKSTGVNMLQPKKKKIKPIGRRFDSKLVPFSTGPHWQNVLGETSYDGFRGYQIEFLNDARPGLNPFTFESADLLPPVEIKSEQINSTLEDDKKMTITSVKSANGLAAASSGSLVKAQSFPSDHLPSLLQNIEGSKAIRPVLLEDLKNKFGHLGKVATKANIEACLNVYAEKLSKKMGAKWVIKQEFRSIAGVCEG